MSTMLVRTSKQPKTKKLIKKRLTKKTVVSHSVARRKKTQTVVPIEPIVHPTQEPILISEGEHVLSPFVINLQSPAAQPETILEDQKNIQLNFLPHSISSTLTLSPTPKDALILSASDIHSQLEKDFDILEHSSLSTSHLSLSSPHSPLTLQPSHPLPSFLPFPNQQSISLKLFFPKQTPQNITTYFEFPEPESEPLESDLVEFDSIPNAILSPLTAHVPPVSSPPSALPTTNYQLPTQRPSFLRPVGAFILISFIFVLPLHAMNLVTNMRQAKTDVESLSKEAFGYLKTGASATKEKETDGASLAFSQASERFTRAQTTISEMGVGTSLLLSAIPRTQTKLATGQHLLTVGEHLTIAGSQIADTFTSLREEVNPTPVSHIRLIDSYLTTIIPHLTIANENLMAVDPSLIPSLQKETFLTLQRQLPSLIESLSSFEELSDLTLAILGADSTKRYLLIFQNNTEIRPTGGFMGSFAEIKVRDGLLEQLTVPTGGTYDLQGFLRQSRMAPAPMQLLSGRWEFQDANWFPDFPTSANQIMEFYSDAGGPSVDGVIAINATYVADLIGLLGEIEMPQYGRTINQENFLFETQNIVEREYDLTENKPKEFIGDLAPKLVDRALKGTPEQFLQLLDHLATGLTQKDIQLHFTNETLQKQILQHGWGGELLGTSRDYLMVVNTNLGGGKTDTVIDEDIMVDVQIKEDGSIENTVTLKRTHHGIPGLVFTGVNNVDYLRLYVPRGSELQHATGFSIPDPSLFEKTDETWILDDDLQYGELTHSTHPASATSIYEEHGKTVFGNWVQTPPGGTSTVQFTYRLPFTVFDLEDSWTEKWKSLLKIRDTGSYSLTIQKQSGILDRATRVSVSVPQNLETLWTSTDNPSASFDNKTDGFFGMLFAGKE